MTTSRLKDRALVYTTLFGSEQVLVDSDLGTGRMSIDVLLTALIARMATDPNGIGFGAAVEAWLASLPTTYAGLSVGDYWMNDGALTRVTAA